MKNNNTETQGVVKYQEGLSADEQVATKDYTPSVEYRFMTKLVKENQYAVANESLYKWSGNHWKKLGDDYLKKQAAKFLGTSVKASKITSCVQVAMIGLSGLPKAPSSRIIIPCKSQYAEIVEGNVVWFEPQKALGFTYFIDTDLSEQHGQKFTEFLDMCIPDKEVQNVLQEYAGYTLLGDCRFERAMLLYGKGANGKSVFIEIIRALHAHAKAMRLDQMKGFELGGIVGASLLTSDETPKAKICGDTLKALISGNTISIREIYKSPYDYANTAKILVSANEYPHFDDSSNGFWRRWFFVPFNQTIPQEKRNPLLAKQIIEQELGSVLQWAVKGLCRLLQSNGQFTAPLSLDREKKAVRQEANSVLGWMADNAITEAIGSHPLSKSEVYTRYKNWADSYDITPVSGNTFWKRLKNEVHFDISDKQKRTNKQTTRYVNLHIKVNWNEASNDDVMPDYDTIFI